MKDELLVQNTGEAAEHYQKVTLTGQYLLAATAIRREISKLKQPIHRLLDFGCGNGKSLWPSVSFIEKGGEAIGVDISPAQLDLAKSNRLTVLNDCSDLSINLHQVINEYAIPYIKCQSIDVTQTSIVLQEIRQEELMQNIMHELYRVLKFGGYFFAACVGDAVVNEDYVSFTYTGFPENAQENSVFRKTRSIEGDFVWENDRHWTQQELAYFAKNAGFSSTFSYDVFADPAIPPFPSQAWLSWKDELITPSVFLFAAMK